MVLPLLMMVFGFSIASLGMLSVVKREETMRRW